MKLGICRKAKVLHYTQFKFTFVEFLLKLRWNLIQINWFGKKRIKLR